MPKIHLSFLWHMHQPFYKDLVNGQYRLPWVRLHALKDYYGMVQILEDFPAVRQTFNLVPSLLAQIEDYAAGSAADPFLNLALRRVEELERSDKEFILNYFFQANEERLIDRYPRYAELFRVLKYNDRNPERALAHFDDGMLRDLQVLSQLAWIDEEYLKTDPQIRDLVRKGRDYSPADQELIGRKQREMIGNVIGVYRKFAELGQIELSTSAYYHPILPLLCDSNIAAESHPYLPLPNQFAYPEDAEEQLRMARDFMQEKFGKTPRGFWPSEGSVSDDTMRIAARLGFHWSASDEGVLGRTLDTSPTANLTYRPYVWRQGADEIRMAFRDHRLSDLIGFVYSQMDPVEAASHFLNEIHKNCQTILKSGRDAVVPIILDGENAWETYAENGRPFLRELYSRISDDPRMSAVTMTEALDSMPAQELGHIFPGSWIDANFDIWIGAKEDNRAWEQLRQARSAYREVIASPDAENVSEENKRRAWEEILIAEGSDWCWWYGPEHSSANRAEFDQLYREHLANVYRLMGKMVPVELSRPNLQEVLFTSSQEPKGLFEATIDGKVHPANEWANAGRYKVDVRSGAMHSQRAVVQELLYGTDGKSLYLRVDLTQPITGTPPLELHYRLRNSSGEEFGVRLRPGDFHEAVVESELPSTCVTAALGDVCELRLSLSALRVRLGDPIHLRLTVMREGLPTCSVPPNGELELLSHTMAEYAY